MMKLFRFGKRNQEKKETENQQAEERLTSVWRVYNAFEDDEFAECEHCGQEAEMEIYPMHYAAICPNCKAIMEKTKIES